MWTVQVEKTVSVLLTFEDVMPHSAVEDDGDVVANLLDIDILRLERGVSTGEVRIAV